MGCSDPNCEEHHMQRELDRLRAERDRLIVQQVAARARELETEQDRDRDRFRAALHELEKVRALYEAHLNTIPGDECRRQVAGHPPSLTARLLFTKETQVHSPSCVGCSAERVLAAARRVLGKKK